MLRDHSDVQNLEELKDLALSVRKATANSAVPTSSHKPPEKPLPDIPVNVTHVYTRQHKTTGLDCPYEGPFRIESRPSRSTVKIEVGIFKNGEKRYEIRHLNDLKLAHPDSLAAPATRPTLGRPKTSGTSDAQSSTEAKPSVTPTTPSNRFPNPTTKQAAGSKQTDRSSDGATVQMKNHATSNPTVRELPSSSQQGIDGPPPVPPFPSRAARSTRNPSPLYVDGLSIEWSSLRPWSATQDEISALNQLISGPNRSPA